VGKALTLVVHHRQQSSNHIQSAVPHTNTKSMVWLNVCCCCCKALLSSHVLRSHNSLAHLKHANLHALRGQFSSRSCDLLRSHIKILTPSCSSVDHDALSSVVLPFNFNSVVEKPSVSASFYTTVRKQNQCLLREGNEAIMDGASWAFDVSSATTADNLF